MTEMLGLPSARAGHAPFDLRASVDSGLGRGSEWAGQVGGA